MRYASYRSREWGQWAQYCRAMAGFYPDFPRRLRRALEISAHQAGISQIPRAVRLAAEREARMRGGHIIPLLAEAAR